MSPLEASPPRPELRRNLLLLLGLALAECLLAAFQWVELLALRRGGTTLCGINATFNCESVWNSRFAAAVHEWLRVPVAGLGLAWGVALTYLCIRALRRQRTAETLATRLSALRLLAVVGVAACVVFAAASLATGSVCLTCLGTYALTTAFAAVALTKLPGPLFSAASPLPRTLLTAFAPVLIAHGVLLLPGAMTPPMVRSVKQLAQALPKQGPDSALAGFLTTLWASEAQSLSDDLQAYRQGLTASPLTPRVLRGEEGALLRVVEFTDIRCSHCRELVENMSALEHAVPPGTLAMDARQFPLDSDCNPLRPTSDGTRIRCLGARAQICLEQAPDYWELRDKLFASQKGLTAERVLAIASSGSVKRAELEACIGAPETEKKLAEDIQYAAQVKPRGTPILFLNGRAAPVTPAFLLAMALARGNPDAPEFARLPPPSRAKPVH